MPIKELGASVSGDRIATTPARLDPGQSVYDPLVSLDKLGQSIDLPLERVGSQPHGLRRATKSVGVSNVSIAPRGGEPVLDRVSLRIETGDRIAVVGRPMGVTKLT